MMGKLPILMESRTNGIFSVVMLCTRLFSVVGVAASSGSLRLVWSNYRQLLLQTAMLVVVSVLALLCFGDGAIFSPIQRVWFSSPSVGFCLFMFQLIRGLGRDCFNYSDKRILLL